MGDIAIHWFRRDLRIYDNPALTEASRHEAVLPVYIHDECAEDEWHLGEASRWWLHHSLDSLKSSLGGNLSFYKGDALTVLSELVERYGVKHVYWNRCYDPSGVRKGNAIVEHFKERGISYHSYNGSLLWEPWEIRKKDGTPYKVFTPFYRKGCLAACAPREPLEAPDIARMSDEKSGSLDDLKLLPEISWYKKFAPLWDVSESGGRERLADFVEDGLSGYKEGRNYPAKQNVSRLSPYLHFGQVSPNQAWYAARSAGDNDDVDCFCSELGWREFSYSLLFYNKKMSVENLQVKFDGFPWLNDSALLERWKAGMTGYPIVDAGMRELWQTGYMHNRVRMIVASFLVKNLMIDWRLGAEHFRDCLVDADMANNSASWQWVAGCGADAAPYFRIFNPVTQGQKFDPGVTYIHRFVPELSRLDGKYLHEPFNASEGVLKMAGVELGDTYPLPIVDLKVTRERALAAYKGL